MERMKQYDLVLDHLRRYGKITQKDALLQYSIERLPARIIELRRDHYKIRTEITVSKNQFGVPVKHATYVFEG